MPLNLPFYFQLVQKKSSRNIQEDISNCCIKVTQLFQNNTIIRSKEDFSRVSTKISSNGELTPRFTKTNRVLILVKSTGIRFFFLIDLEPNGMQFGYKPIGKWWIQFHWGWFNKNQKLVSLCDKRKIKNEFIGWWINLLDEEWIDWINWVTTSYKHSTVVQKTEFVNSLGEHTNSVESV